MPRCQRVGSGYDHAASLQGTTLGVSIRQQDLGTVSGQRDG